MATPVETSPFSPIRFYDVPELVISQMFDGEATFQGIRDTFFNPSGLSPAQREGIAERLKEAAGRHSVTDALIDVVTNPLVWLMFVTSPAAARAVGEGLRGFSLASKFVGDVRTTAPLAQSMRLTTSLESLEGMPAAGALMQLNRNLSDTAESFVRGLDAAQEEAVEVASRYGVNLKKGLDWRRYRVGTKEAEYTKRMERAVEASLNGYDRDVVAVSPVLKDGKIVARETHFERRVQADVATELKEKGWWNFREAVRRQLLLRAVDMYGKPLSKAVAAGSTEGIRAAFEVDTDKVRTVWRALRMMKRGGALEGLTGTLQGSEAVARVVGADVEALARATRGEALEMGEDEIVGMVRDLVEIPIKQNDAYLPRNLTDYVGAALGREDIFSLAQSNTFIALRNAVPRMVGRPFRYHPDDLMEMKRLFGATEALDTEIAEITADAAAAKLKGESIPVFRHDLFRGLNKYNKNTSETIEMFVRPPEDTVRLLLKEQQARLSGLKGATQDEVEAIDRWKASQAKLGAQFDYHNPKSLAEVFARDATLLGDKGARDEMVNVWVPRVAGRLRRSEAAVITTMIHTKKMASALAESSIGKAIEGSGEWGKGFVARLKHYADPVLSPAVQSADTFERWLTRYLYVTHLGFNLGSVVLNMTQPMLHATTWAGAGNVLKGYAAAAQEMGGYLAERVAKHGVQPLGAAEHSDLIRKHFRYANVKGKDLLGITDSLPATFDSFLFGPQNIGARTSKADFFFDTPMKLFEKAEWWNRSVTAHAVENMWRGAGRYSDEVGNELRTARLLDTERMVQETQFGGSVVNQPTLFMTGLLSNGLLRQFMTFPIRSFVSTFHVGARVGGRESLFGNMSNTVFRGLAMSAITYELTKNLLGADLSRGLFASSVTDVLGGHRIVESDAQVFPVPPVIDIPVGLMRGLAQGDMDLVKRSLHRLLPPPFGGVGLARLWEIAPTDFPGGQVLKDFQRLAFSTYVDWDTPQPDGSVAVRRSDGSLIAYMPPHLVLLRGLGIDLGAYKTEGELTRFLLQNRDQFVGARHEMLRRLMANDVSGAMSVKAEFEKRYKLPLTITKQQIEEYAEGRRVPRAERILERLPAEARPIYTEIVGQAGFTGLPPSEFSQGQTTAAREQLVGRRPSGVKLDPETLEALRQLSAEKDRLEAARTGRASARPQPGYSGFEAF